MPFMGGSAPASALVDELPGWVTLIRAPNPGPMTLDGTNTWVLRAPGDEYAVVVDPGPDDDDHLAAVAAHGPVAFILITHGHHDHVEGAARLSRLLGDVAVLAADPEQCIAGEAFDHDESMGVGELDINVLTTPGHTGDSVCFLVGVGDERVLLTGDTVLGRGTTVVAWPDGDLGRYLTSLERLAAYPLMMLPGHGPALADCGAVARAYLAHRRERLDQVRAALAAGDTTAEEVVARVYADVDASVRFAAEWSVRAQLDFLRRESPAGPHGLDRP
jgi:glyoxylase-like metal-dependent hydrolase (beta-lactamase superfamily II)